MNVRIVGAFVIIALLAIILDGVSANQAIAEVQPKINGELIFKLKIDRFFYKLFLDDNLVSISTRFLNLAIENSTIATKSEVKPQQEHQLNANPEPHHHRHHHNRKACDLTHSSNMCRKHCLEKGFKRGFCNKLSVCRCRHH